MSHQMSEVEKFRREKLAKIVQAGISPFPAEEYKFDCYSKDLKENFKEGLSVSLAGRIMSRRIQGAASFAELQDSKGRMQLYFNRDEICKTEDKFLYNDLYKKLLDIGDFIGVKGETFLTQLGEPTVLVKEFTLLTKSIKPLPLPKTDDEGVVHDAFTDPEQRYRQRYVDLVVNPKTKDVFKKRTKVFSAMRSFFNIDGYLEVETPVLQSIPGGAAARPFVTHHNALDIPLFLRIANELYLKRLIVGGFEGVYEFSKNFRNEGMDRTHNPEFTAMEIYVAYKDYYWMMNYTEKLLEFVATEVNGSPYSQFGEHKISWKAPYPRISMRDSILKYTDFDIDNKSEEELREAAKNMGLEVDNTMGKGKLIDEIFGNKCEPHFIQPTFIIDYPIEMSPLTKKHRNNPAYTERFEIMVCGKEIANAYSELNDPIDQRERFEHQLLLSEKGDDEAMHIDYDFLRALEYGMPPTSGLGIGMDRLVMFLTDNASIQEVLFFPQMKPEKKQLPLSEDEKTIIDLIEGSDIMPLEDLKTKTGFSNKKWDKTLKLLSKKDLVEITKDENGIFVAKK